MDVLDIGYNKFDSFNLDLTEMVKNGTMVHFQGETHSIALLQDLLILNLRRIRLKLNLDWIQSFSFA